MNLVQNYGYKQNETFPPLFRFYPSHTNKSWDPDPTTDPATDPAIFVSDLQNDNLKIFFSFPEVFFLNTYFLKLHISFFKAKKSYKIHKTEEIKVFRTIFDDDRRIRIRIRTSY